MPTRPSHMPRRLILATSLALLAACGNESTPDEFVAKAEKQFQAAAYDAATIELNNALQRDSQHKAARWLLAQTALATGDGPKAERDARRALELGVPASEAVPVIVRAIMLQRDFKRALTEAVNLPPDAPAAVRADLGALRGKIHLFSGDTQAAEGEFDAALTLNADSPEALHGKAMLHNARGEVDESRKLAERAIEIAPKDPDPWALIGELALDREQYAEAEAALTKALERRHFATLEPAKRALARIRLGKLDEADADLGTLSKNRLKHFYADYVRGILRLRQGRTSEAANAFESSFVANPNFVPNRVYLATTRLLLGQPEQALVHADFIRRIAPESIGASRLTGAVHASRGDYAAARGILQTALEKQPDDPATVQMLGLTSLLEGDRKGGLAYAERLAALEADNPRASNLLVLAQLLAGAPLEASLTTMTGDEAFRSSFLLALGAFRDNKLDVALERALALEREQPDAVDPPKLAAAVYLATGNWAEARRTLERIRERWPEDGDVRRNLARLEFNDGKFERTRELLAPLAERSPVDEASLLLLASAEHELGQPDRALRLLEEALQRQADADTVRVALGKAYLARGDYRRVLELLRTVTDAQAEKLPTFLELRGIAQMETGDFANARGNFERLTRLQPQSGPAQFHLAESLARAGDGVNARKALVRSLELAPRHLPARIGEIRMLTLGGELERAADAVARLEKDFEASPAVLSITGWHALVTGQFAAAEEKLRKVFASRPDTELLVLITRALWGQGKHAEAFAHLQGWLETNPRDAAALLNLAGAHLDLGQDDKALAVYRQVHEYYPNHVPTLNNIAWLSRKEKPAEALRMAQQARDLAPEDPDVLDTLGMLYLDNKDLTQAIWFVGQALERNPTNRQIRLHMAQVQHAKGQTAEARKNLRILAEAKDDEPLTRQARALLKELDAGR